VPLPGAIDELPRGWIEYISSQLTAAGARACNADCSRLTRFTVKLPDEHSVRSRDLPRREAREHRAVP